MIQPVFTTNIILTEEKYSKDVLEKYFLALSDYFKGASENTLLIDNNKYEIKVNNRFLSPPQRNFGGRTPKESEMFPFDIEVKIFSEDELKIQMKISYFPTLITYILFLGGCLALSLFSTKGNINNACKFIIPFFFIIITLYMAGMAAIKTFSFRNQLINIYKKNMPN